MDAQVHEASLAFTYAWWLTGDDEVATAAVGEAARALAPADEGEQRVATLLREVRRIAAPERTMCPASELALLHDAHDLPLDLAASLAEIAPEEARTELAHGRLEALLETVDDAFAHPERLGGLAVGNPPDIAHARTCRSCATTLDLLRRGRQELSALPPIPAPPALIATLTQRDAASAEAAATGPVRVSRRSATPLEAPGTGEPLEADETAASDAPAPLVFDDLAELDPSELDPAELESAEQPRHARRRSLAAGIAAVLLGTGVLAATALTADRRDAVEEEGASSTTGGAAEEEVDQVAEVEVPTATEAGATPVEPEPAPEPEPEPAATADVLEDDEGQVDAAGEPLPFTVLDAGVLPPGAPEPQPSGTAIASDDALRLSVVYSGAAEGVVLAVVPDMPAELAGPREVTLSSQRSSHVVVWLAPTEGWPQGRHQIQLLADGELAGVVDVTVE